MAHHINYITLEGSKEQRLNKAIETVEQLLKKQKSNDVDKR